MCPVSLHSVREEVKWHYTRPLVNYQGQHLEKIKSRLARGGSHDDDGSHSDDATVKKKWVVKFCTIVRLVHLLVHLYQMPIAPHVIGLLPPSRGLGSSLRLPLPVLDIVNNLVRFCRFLKRICLATWCLSSWSGQYHFLAEAHFTTIVSLVL